MEEARLGLMSRIWLALWLPFKVLFDGRAAARIERVLQPAPPAPAKVELAKKAEEPKKPAEADASQALHLLAVLQRDGRFVDFLQEDVAVATDDQVGAAARIVHEGCRKALSQYFTLAPIRKEEEGARITVQKGFDAGELRLVGNVVGEGPWSGTLTHAGWRAVEVRFPAPPAGQDVRVIAPAEVEV